MGNLRATAKVKITPTGELLRTLKLYKRGLQFCVDSAWSRRIKNNVKLHPFVYTHLRELGLQSQLAIACIKQACGMVKKAKTKPHIKRTSMRYNFPRSASMKNNVLSLATVKGRQKFPFVVPSCYQDYFAQGKICESLLRLDRKGRCFFLFTFSLPTPAQRKKKSTLGIDLGINTLAATSQNKLYKVAQVKKIKRKYTYLRSTLQAKGTRSAKRLLKKLSGKEKRFMTWVNHNVSKEIATSFLGNKIVLEKLKGIRKKRRGKRLNTMLSNWSFFQLQRFITYKAAREGISVQQVNPMFTSQICSSCNNIGVRQRGFFSCSCGFSLNADLNASRNLAQGISYVQQGAINRPYISSDEAKAQVAVNCS